MTARSSVNQLAQLSEQIDVADPDVLRQLVKIFAETPVSAEADSPAGQSMGSARRAGRTAAKATVPATGTRGQAASSWRCPSCGRGRISRNGCWPGAAAPNRKASHIAPTADICRLGQ